MTKTPLRAIVALRRAGFSAAEIDGFDDAEFFAHSVVLGELEGGQFEWERLEWRKPDAP